MDKKATLWTKNFTIITLGTIISAIGGTAMGFAFSFVVFDNSQSTLLAGIFHAVSMIPAMVLPIVVSPYIDHFRRKPVIVGLDCLNGILYLLFGLYLLNHPFQYSVYMAFSLVISSIGTIYNLAYTSLYPNLIEEGFSQKGYTISGMIYPTVMMLITPAAGYLYTRLGIEFICIMEGVLLLAASAVETQIKVEERLDGGGRFSWKSYLADMKEGLHYFKREKGLQRIYAYMPLAQGVSEGSTSLVIAYFQTTPGLGTALYAWFMVAEFIGRTVGGLVHYHFEIKAERRFSFAYMVYQVYNLMDSILLWLGYPLMLANRAACGFLGINSATLRESSVQNYLPDDKRAKLNGFFNAIMSLTVMACCTVIGALGEALDYRVCISIVAAVQMILCHGIIFQGRKHVKKIYNQKW